MPKKQLTIEEKMNNALVPEEEWPYKLPDNWCWVRLGELFQVNPKNNVENDDIEAAFIPMALIDSDFSGEYSYEIKSWKEAKNGHTQFANKDVAFAKISPCFENGKAFIANNLPNGIGAGTTELVVLRNIKIVPQYTFYLLSTDRFVNGGRHTYSGVVGQQRISMDYVKSYAFPLPPLPEQQRIVARIESLFDKLDEAKEKIQNVLDGAESRKAAILHQAFTGKLTAKWRKENKYSSQEFFCKIRNYLSEHKKKKVKIKDNLQFNSVSKMIPKDWILVNLDSISERITDGEHKTPRRVDSYCGYYLLSARNVHDDTLNLDNVDFIDSIEYGIISKRCNPKKGDILLSCSGSVGRCCVISDENKYCMVRSVAVISQPSCNSRFIMYMIQSEIVQEQIHKMSKQTAQANLFLGAIASLAIPLPSREEQDYIVDILDDKFAKEKSICESCEASLAAIEAMKKAILAKAFRGELGTNNPAEESSKELLREIISI